MLYQFHCEYFSLTSYLTNVGQLTDAIDVLCTIFIVMAALHYRSTLIWKMFAAKSRGLTLPNQCVTITGV